MLNRTYYYTSKDESVKFLLYDWFNHKYRLVDISNGSTMP